jgi:serine protease AprX
VRRTIGLVVLAFFSALVPSASSAAPSDGRPPRASDERRIDPPLADLDADGLSDGLEAKLRQLASSDHVSVIVTFDGPGGVASAREAVGAFRVTRSFDLVRGFAATVTKSQALELARLPGVFRVERNVQVHAFVDSADRDFGAERARADFGVTGSGIEICVVDTGVDPNHEQLDKAPIAWFDAVSGLAAPYDDHGHGTHVAAIAAGDATGGPNAATFGGVAPGASLSAAKVLNAAGSGWLSEVMAGIEWCAARASVRVISMSLGTSAPSDGQDGISQAVNEAAAAGKVVVVAAGNSGDDPSTVGAPGAAAGAITVGAVAEWSAPVSAANHSDGAYLAYFSSRGPTLDGRIKPDIASPGVSITSADAGTSNEYVTFSGTSMATPFVSGTVALALQASPGWTVADIRNALEGTAADRGVAGKDNDYGAGLVDAHAFVAAAAGSASDGAAFPTWSGLSASVADHGMWSGSFSIGSADLGVPIAATVIIEGAPVCVELFVGSCLDYDWGPDLEARLVDPTGAELDVSTCPLGGECGNGRQETVHAMPTVAGTYRLEVFPTEDAPHNGRGGSFHVDLSTGPIGGSAGPPPSPPPPVEIHVGDLDGSSARSGSSRWLGTVTITVHDAAHVAVSGVTVSGLWERVADDSSITCITNADGTCSVGRRFSNRKTARTFSIVGLPAVGKTYVAGSNHDPDGDSSGTRITLVRP